MYCEPRMNHVVQYNSGKVTSFELDPSVFCDNANFTASTRIAIVNTIVGAPVDLPILAVAARIRAAVPFGVNLVDMSPLQLASTIVAQLPTAVTACRVGQFSTEDIRRLTESWQSIGCVYLSTPSLSVSYNLALDDVLVERVRSGRCPVVLRVWNWSETAIIIGRSQSVVHEVDAVLVASTGLKVARRASGGGAMYVSPNGVITYSIIVPESALSGLSIRQSYEVCDAWAVLALRDIGIDAHYIPINDIGCAEGKIAGAAQARRNGVVIHHTTMAYDVDVSMIAAVLRLTQPRIHSRGVASAPKVISPLVNQTSLSREAIISAMTDRFMRDYHATPASLTSDEFAAAEQIARTKYESDDWLLGRDAPV